MVGKIDSNLTGLRVAAEDPSAIGTLPGSGVVWYPLDPNSYGDFGGNNTLTARTPINAGRQRQAGVVTDLEASAAFQIDLTPDSAYLLLPGYMFADWRAKDEDAFTAVSGGAFTIASGGTDYRANDLVFVSGSSVSSNNGVKTVSTGATGTTVPASGLTNDASPSTDPKIKRVGHQFASGDASITVTGGVPALEAAAKDLTQLGVIPGEWLFIGGDTTGTKFATAADNGWVRVSTVTAGKIEFDKTQSTMVADAGVGKTIRVFIGDVVKNEVDPALQVRKSYQYERSLGSAGYEYVVGAVSNQLTLTLSTAAKVTADLTFVATGHEADVASVGAPKAGTRPALSAAGAYNTSSDFGRIRLAKVDNTGLESFLLDATLTINNNVTPAKALGVLGAFDVNAGDFVVGGNVNAYFTTLATVAAVRSNADATMDFSLVKSNRGLLFDVALTKLGNGRLQVEKDRPIRIPLSMEAAEHSTLRHTLLAMHFRYLPDAAM